MGVSKLSAKVFLKVNYSFKTVSFNEPVMDIFTYIYNIIKIFFIQWLGCEHLQAVNKVEQSLCLWDVKMYVCV